MAIKIFLLSVNFILVIGVLWGMYRIIRWAFGFMRRLGSSLHLELVFSMMGLATGLLIFPSVFSSAFHAIVGFFVENISFITKIFNGQALAQSSGAENVQTLDEATRLAEYWSITATSLVAKFFSGLNIEQIILFVVTWFGGGLFFQNIFRLYAKPKPEVANDIIIGNTLVTLGLLFSLYLSMAAIIAIPVFQMEETRDEKVVQDFDKELENNAMSDTTFDQKFIPADIFQRYGLRVAQDSSNPANPPSKLVERALVRYVNLAESAGNDLKQSRLIVQRRFQGAFHSKINNNLIIQYKDDLIDWYLEKENATSRYLSSEWSDTETFINLSQNANEDGVSDNILLGYLENIKSAGNQFPVRPMPERPKMGADFGIFKWFSGWLLDAETSALALIVGLLGFGLLGSAASTYIRETPQRAENPLIINDLSGVTVRGVTAAIVVFLAVKGGLSVFSNGSEDVDPYALFFSCFLAAVFSEDVWDWAHDRLKSNLGDENEGTEPAKKVPESTGKVS